MNRLTTSCLFAAAGIGIGAFGAHALKETLEANGSLEPWRTGVLYHLVHAIALFVLAATGKSLNCSWTFRLWSIGIIFFSGSLYGLALTGWGFLGPITPVGGLAFIAGWIVLIFENRKVS